MKLIKSMIIGCFSLLLCQPVFANPDFQVDPIELNAFFEKQDAYYEENAFETQGPLFDHNALLVTENGLETISWDLELMRNAKHSIELSGSFCGGQIFRDMLAIMQEKLESIPNFQVHILTSPTLIESEEEQTIKNLEKRFPSQFHFLYTSNVLVLLPDLSSIDNHVKLVVVDEKYFTTGGTNKDDTLASDGTYPPSRNGKGGIVGAWLPAGVRDMDIVGYGPAAKMLRLQFYKLYSLWLAFHKKGSLPKKDEESPEFNCYFPIQSSDLAQIEALDQNNRLIHNPNIRMIFSGPMHQPNKITKEYEKLMDNAQYSIVVANLYWNPAEMVLRAAKRAVNRNVPFTLYTNGINDLTPKYNDLFAWASRINYVPLFYGRDFHIWEFSTAKKCPVRNARIYEYRVKDILYHKKLMVVDDHLTLIGSYNLGTKSDRSDYELVLVIDSEEVASDVLNVLRRDQQLSVEVSSEQARDWYFNPITAYLAGTQKSFHGFMSVPYDDKGPERSNELAKKMKEWKNQNSVVKH